ncbi:E3 ubiquitin/ISG15 ligase TRIM25-like [Heptranchias perlo]|uniref:E3 ubiquitin/ISG15 ligase TRIM25-like n=1 Tax=Heptranchias perlo TaxID=212740 RepID=UPI0035596354
MEPGALEDELTCAVCLQVYQDPVVLSCQHSFCLKCIEGVWAQTPGPEGFECPQCRQKFNPRPSLKRNFTLCNIVEKYNQSQPPADSARVVCDACIENPSPAVKTCLFCLASFCSLHLKPHLLKEAYKDHTLIEPVADLTDRQCVDHKKVLEFYCKDDAECVCVSCIIIGKHKSHTLLSLDQAQAAIKEELEREIGSLRGVQQNCSSKQRDFERSEAEIKTRINELKGKLSKSFSEWRRQLEEDEEYALKLIDEEGLRALSQIRSCSEALNKRMEQITLIDGESQRLVQRDHLSFIQGNDINAASTCFLCCVKHAMETEKRFLHVCTRFPGSCHDSFILRESNIPALFHAPNRLKGWLLGDKGNLLQSWLMIPVRNPISEAQSQCNDSHITTSLFHSRVTETQRVTDPDVPALTLNLSNISQLIQKRLNGSGKYHSDILGIIVPASTEYRGPSNVTPPPHSSSGAAPVPGNVLQLSTGITGRAGISQGQRSPMSLDPKTVNWNLVLSDDLRSVTRTEWKQPYPPHPERFKDRPQVLCSQSFSSGSHSWDTETDGKCWGIGIVCGSVEREGDKSDLRLSRKSWCLDFHYGSLTAAHYSQFTDLPLTPSNIRIRVQLDYEAGTLSFHRVTDSLRHLHTFQTTFTEPVFPAFYCGNKSLKLLN